MRNINKNIQSLFNIWDLIYIVLLLTLIILVFIRIYSGSTYIADLGFFLNNFSNVTDQWQRAFYGHVQPLMLLIGIVYEYIPINLSAYFLIAIQTIGILFGCHLVYKNFGHVPGIVMLLYTPLWSVSLFDFHLDFLLIPLLALFFIYIKNNEIVKAFFTVILIMFVKEPYALEAIGCGIYMIIYGSNNLRIFSNINRLKICGFFTIILGFIFFSINMNIVVPSFSMGVESFAISGDAYSWMGSGYLDIIIYILSSPIEIFLKIITNYAKLKYLFILFGSLAFIPLLNPLPIVICLPILLISLLSNNPGYYDYTAHYSAGLIIPLIVSFSGGLKKINEFNITRYNMKILYLVIAFTILMTHIIFGFSPISRLFWSEKIDRFNFRNYINNSRNEMIYKQTLLNIPNNRNLIVSAQNNINNSYLAHRSHLILYPMGVFGPYKYPDWGRGNFLSKINYYLEFKKNNNLIQNLYADYVLIDLKKNKYLGDKSCIFIYNKCTDLILENEFNESLELIKLKYKEIYSNDGFIIYKRVL